MKRQDEIGALDALHQPVYMVGQAQFKCRGTVLPLFTNGSLSQPSQPWQTVLIIVHGRKRNAGDYFDVARHMVEGTDASTLIIAPQFLADVDIKAHGLDNNYLYWDELGWMGGDDALGPESISGFAVFDDLIEYLSDRSKFPDLRRIIVAGHSGGGQVVHRYAVLSGTTADIHFIVANPSSYVYFSKDRVNEQGFFIPSEDAYPGYNSWKYGMENRPAYGQGYSDKLLEERYVARNVTYLLGACDSNPEHLALDRTAPAMAQGMHRLGRGRAYWRYLQERHGPALHHRYFEIPGVGHDPLGIFTTSVARASLFEQTSHRGAK